MKVGLEVHQQLATGKLFCNCPCELSETVTGTMLRRLRATGGEEQTVDRAAAFEATRGQVFQYETTTSDCLVEADEEPPHALNPAARDVALTVAALLHARPLDEIVVMRKIVIDGSNTSGFQRTALIATDGTLEVEGRQYSIPTICLEEDAARKVGEGEGSTHYRLDRLGIPLIEVATGPEITTGEEARAVAQEIGAVLRSTRRVRRGIGTIREDVNVSTPGGTRIEIKGVQELRLIQRYVEKEEERQKVLLHVRSVLHERGATSPPSEGTDVGALVGGLTNGPLRDTGRRGATVLGLRLPGFAGLLGSPQPDGERLGRELADYARSTGLKGLLHSDELPGYGLDETLVARIREAIGASKEDAFVLLTAPTPELAARALARVRERAILAFDGVPPETRDPLPDGRSRYSRPLPGRDRMYPETDVPPIQVAPDAWRTISTHLPEMPAATRARLAERYHLHAEVVLKLQQEDELDRFETLVASGHPAGTVARLLTQELPLALEEIPPVSAHIPDDGELGALLAALTAGQFAKEGLGRVLHHLVAHGGSVETAIAAAGIEPLSRAELERLTEELLDQNAALLADKGERAISPLMGDLMRRVRGRRDGREIAQVLEAAVRSRLAAAPRGA